MFINLNEYGNWYKYLSITAIIVAFCLLVYFPIDLAITNSNITYIEENVKTVHSKADLHTGIGLVYITGSVSPNEIELNGLKTKSLFIRRIVNNETLYVINKSFRIQDIVCEGTFESQYHSTLSDSVYTYAPINCKPEDGYEIKQGSEGPYLYHYVDEYDSNFIYYYTYTPSTYSVIGYYSNNSISSISGNRKIGHIFPSTISVTDYIQELRKIKIIEFWDAFLTVLLILVIQFSYSKKLKVYLDSENCLVKNIP